MMGAANPQLTQIAQPSVRLRRPAAGYRVVAAEQPPVCALRAGILEHGVERGEIRVDIEQKGRISLHVSFRVA